MNILILGGDLNYQGMFESLGYTIVGEMKEAGLVCFTGGADVSPTLYHQDAHHTTSCHPQRDLIEMEAFAEAKSLGIPMVGICRGAQFLHVMNGGELYQDVDEHDTGAPHELLDVLTGITYVVTSTHHQMMRYDGSGTLVATAFEVERVVYLGNAVGGDIYDKDIEVIWHVGTKCLCFQPHPEFSHEIEGAETTYLYFKNLLVQYIERCRGE